MTREANRPAADGGSMHEDAADWVARGLAGEGIDPPGLQAWLAADPAHRTEFEAMSAMAGDPALLQALSAFDTKRPAQASVTAPVPLRHRRSPRRWRWPAAALAAALALAAVLWPWWRPAPPPVLASTLPGQTRVLALDDGSVLTLNGGSRVRVQLHARRREVVLEAGEVFFDVAHDPRRPFEVTMGPTRVRVLGTVFNLARDGATSELSVYSGRVEIVGGSARRLLGRGARIDADGGRLGTPVRFDPDAGDWRAGWLQTPGISLSRLVARLNRRSPQPIVIADPALAALQVSGRFRLDRPEQTLAHLARLHSLRIQRSADGIALQRDASARR